VAVDPLDARPLPATWFTSDEILRIERERWLDGAAMCVARTDELPEPGSFRTVSVPSTTGHRSVLVVRGDDGVLRAFHNVCVHRGAELVAEPAGTAARFRCPYHAWTYRLDGSLAATPFLETPDVCLPSVPVHEWHGFVFVGGDGRGPAELVPPLDAVVARYRPERYVTVQRLVEVWDTNWKCLVDNFLDAYHLFHVHRATFRTDGPPAATTFHDGTDHGAFHTVVDDPNGRWGVSHADDDVLEGVWRHSLVLGVVFPGFVFQLQPDWLWALDITPVDVDRVRISSVVAAAPAVLDGADDRAAYVEELLTFLAQVNAEDRAVVEAVQRGMRSGIDPAGPLHPLERTMTEFDDAVRAVLGGAADGSGGGTTSS
jgi:choline monooxygenase